MKPSFVNRLGALALAATAVVLSGCGSDAVRDAPTAEPLGPRAPSTDAERQELSFLIGMVPHHAQAVDMGKLCTQRAHRPELHDMCIDIVTTQAEEISRMRRWALDWYGTQLSEVQSALFTTEGASGSEGTLPDERMAELAALAGAQFDARFLALMTEHHEGAIQSAEALIRVSPHPEVRQLATAIVAAQRSEVRQMAEWRSAWSA